MNKFKKLMSTVVEASGRPAESWRFLRQAVRELRVVLQGVTSVVVDFEARLDRLEAAATKPPAPKTATSPRRATRKAAAPPRKSAARKTGKTGKSRKPR